MSIEDHAVIDKEQFSRSISFPSGPAIDLQVQAKHRSFQSHSGNIDEQMMGAFLHGISNDVMLTEPLSAELVASLPDILDFGYDDPFAATMDYYSDDFANEVGMFAPEHSPHPDRGLQIDMNGSESVEGQVHKGHLAFREALWLWDPTAEDNAPQSDALPSDTGLDLNLPQTRLHHNLRISISTQKRLQALATTISGYIFSRRVRKSVLPSAKAMSLLLESFRSRHAQQISSWIHLQTVEINEECEEFVLALICAGAADSSEPQMRAFSCSLQQVIRFSLLRRLESNNKFFRDLRLMQAFILVINVGLNSASRREIEIAESMTLMLVTMLRRGGHFRAREQTSNPHTDQAVETLQSRWQTWAMDESLTRLAHHVLYQDVQTSSALFRSPILSYSELDMSMPCSDDLWQSKTALQWQQQFLDGSNACSSMITLQKCALDPKLLRLVGGSIDLQMSFRTLIYIFYLRTWQYTQMRSFCTASGPNFSSDLLNHVSQQLKSSSWDLQAQFLTEITALHPCCLMVFHLCLMYLHASLDDIQQLGGKDGEHDARQATTRLKAWTKTSESRQALYHAGQIVRAVADCPAEFLRGYHAVVSYQASLVLWSYSLLMSSHTTVAILARQIADTTQTQAKPVQLDGGDGPEVKSFITWNEGTACIQDWTVTTNCTSTWRAAFIHNPEQLLLSISALLSTHMRTKDFCVPIVDYLSNRMTSLAKASTAMQRLRRGS